ncbi:endolytic transglycosylase MltG [Thioalkalivibrio sulfidiphilus]|uniref:endolytic transglycosylase MltG n=1 Tax=Thioalkalivibrio sulfidiphilus TaxID=1033854 RepID=UPI00037A32AB|nr:endolytic transglycosylase MltG [Thioalkalivibrio sulfidiphilus]
MRRLLLGVLFLLVLALVAAAGLGYDYLRFMDEPLALSETQVYEVPPGASVRRVARDLHEAGWLERPAYWEFHARVEAESATIRAGEYRLEPGLTPRSLLALFTAGRTVQYSLTIPEGWTFAQMMAAVRAHPQIRQTLDPAGDMEIMDRLGRPGEHPEGWFFPDTYLFPRDTTDIAFLERAHRRMVEFLDAAWAERQEGLPIESPYQALILASIVEKETGHPDERDLVAAVFNTRLKRGMRLQTDPAVMYGAGITNGRLRTRDLRTDTPYNTYTRAGLPPTPIALPGGASIRATLNPADTEVLFFVSRGDGSHHFSTTYREHREAVIRYQLGGDASRYPGSRR